LAHTSNDYVFDTGHIFIQIPIQNPQKTTIFWDFCNSGASNVWKLYSIFWTE